MWHIVEKEVLVSSFTPEIKIMQKAKYEQSEHDRKFNIVYAAYQDRRSLLESYLSGGCESDYVMALEVAIECRDLVRMDLNNNLGIFHSGNHAKLIKDLTPPFDNKSIIAT